MPLQHYIRLFTILIFIGLTVVAPAGAQPAKLTIDRIDPPSWWSTPSLQTVTLLVEGQGLKGVPVTSNRAGLRITAINTADDGTAAFVDVTLLPAIMPGPVTLTFESEGARVEREWIIHPRRVYRPTPIGPDDVIYLAMPDRFANGDPANDSAQDVEPMLDRQNPHAYHGGDFAGLKAKLPYLVDLGATALWLTPVYRPAPKWFHTKVAGRPRKYADFHGYSPVDFYDTNPHFGSQDEYRALVDEAHRLGLKVIQDQVLGYTGPQHHWVAQPPGADWFHGPLQNPPPCNFRFDALTNPHALESDRRGLTDGWFFGILPDLNVRNAQVSRYAIQQSLWWTTRFSADGIRLDTYPMVDRTFWRDWSRSRQSEVPGVRAIGEAWINDPADLSFFQSGFPAWDGIDPGVESVFDFPLNLALVEVVSKKAPASRLGKALARDGLYPRPDRLVTFLDNHDTPRLAAVPEVTPARYRLAVTFLLTTRGIPQLTWGDEINLPGHGDDRQSIPGAWPGDSRDAFSATGRTPEEQATFEAFQTLLRLRKNSPALRLGRTVEVAATKEMFAFVRVHQNETILSVLNFDAAPADLVLPKEPLGTPKTLERVFGEGQAIVKDGTVSIAIPGERAGVFRVR